MDSISTFEAKLDKLDDHLSVLKKIQKKLHHVSKKLAILNTVQLKDMESIDKALKLQAIVYEKQIETLNKEVANLMAFKDNYAGRNYIITIIISVLISGIALVTNYLLKQ